jgi:hypothetical protein
MCILFAVWSSARMKAGDPWTESLACSICGLSGGARLSQPKKRRRTEVPASNNWQPSAVGRHKIDLKDNLDSDPGERRAHILLHLSTGGLDEEA